MVHRLGSGAAIADWLGDDCPLMSFQGIFSGANAINRARTLEELRTDGRPLVLTWDMHSSYVLVQDVELNYQSANWIKYRLTCLATRTAELSATGDALFQSPASQISAIFDLLTNSGENYPAFQRTSLMELAAGRYDLPPAPALQSASDLLESVRRGFAAADLYVGTQSLETFATASAFSARLIDLAAQARYQAVSLLALNRISEIQITATSGRPV